MNGTALRWATITPLGWPVLPEVNSKYATPSGSTALRCRSSAEASACGATNLCAGYLDASWAITDRPASSASGTTTTNERPSVATPSSSSPSCDRASGATTSPRTSLRISIPRERSTGKIGFSGT